MRRQREASSRDLTRSLPVRSTFGLPVYVVASPAAPFSTPLGMTEKEQQKCRLDFETHDLSFNGHGAWVERRHDVDADRRWRAGALGRVARGVRQINRCATEDGCAALNR